MFHKANMSQFSPR